MEGKKKEVKKGEEREVAFATRKLSITKQSEFFTYTCYRYMFLT